jgi:carboxymethylenebutenolidase
MEFPMSVSRSVGSAIALAVAMSACMLQQRPPARTAAVDDHMSHMMAADLKAPTVVAGDYQGTPGLPPSANSAPARLKASPRHAEWVKIAWEPGSKDSLMAWIVYPSTSRQHTPVVVVVHEIFGLQTWVRGVADQVAADGFIAIAPDLNSRVRGGPSTDELTGDSARKLINGVSIPERNRGITAVAEYAMSQPSAERKYAVIGYCWGGTTVWGHSIDGGKGFVGGVAFYGSFPYSNGPTPNADSMAKIKTPVMLLSGTKDPRITASMPAIDSMMKAMHKDYYGKNYEGAEHGFLRAQDDVKTPPDPAGAAANLVATTDGWPKTIAFLKKNLGLN